MNKQTYVDNPCSKPSSISIENAKAEAWTRRLFWMLIRVAICSAAVAVLVLSHFYAWMVPVLQVTGVVSLIVIAAINIDRFVQFSKNNN